MTPEQVAEAVVEARRLAAKSTENMTPDEREIRWMGRALLAEHERANTEHELAEAEFYHRAAAELERDANARDAARWRAVRKYVENWAVWVMLDVCYVGPATVDEAADRLIAEQEARDG